MGLTVSELDHLQERLGYTFRDRALLEEALRHPSLASNGSTAASNQRLEFLGDAVLQLVVSEVLFRNEPESREGPLSRRRASLTKGPTLAGLAAELGLDRALDLSPAEEHSGGRARLGAREDVFEALVGAVYLDRGYEAARTHVLRWYGPLGPRLAGQECSDNPKGRIQELVQPLHGNTALRYAVARIKGEPHERRFEVQLYLLDRLVGTGSGSSKKEAEENAAREALAQWKPPSAPS